MKVLISLLTYETENVEKVIESILVQTYKNFQLIISDNSETLRVFTQIKTRYPYLKLYKNNNIGYGSAHNKIIEGFGHEFEAVLLLNDDLVLDDHYLFHLVSLLKSNRQLAGVTGKLFLVENLENLTKNKQDVSLYKLNSFIKIRKVNKRDSSSRLFGITGAAPLLSLSALRSLRGEVFDSDYFMYHEDIDLCWRLNNLGFQFDICERSIAFHRRSYNFRNRFELSADLRKLPLRNRYLSIIKNESCLGLVLKLPSLLAYEIVQFIYLAIFDPKLLTLYAELIQRLPSFVKKRALIKFPNKMEKQLQEKQSC